MADKTKTTELERIYTIPLRDAKDLVRSRRANNAVRDVKRFLTRHMKTEQVWVDNEVNEALWANGKFRIPSRIRVRATRFSDGVVEVTLPDTAHKGSVRGEIADRKEKAQQTQILKAPESEEGEAAGHDHPVTDVQGIGPATAEKLAKAEIETVADLAEADAAEVAKSTGIAQDKVEEYIASAKKFAESHSHEGEAPAAEDKAEPNEGQPAPKTETSEKSTKASDKSDKKE